MSGEGGEIRENGDSECVRSGKSGWRWSGGCGDDGVGGGDGGGDCGETGDCVMCVRCEHVKEVVRQDDDRTQCRSERLK